MAYSNGRLPDSALGYIAGTNKRLIKDLLPQTDALRAAFKAHFNKDLGITDAYRDYATQVRLRAQKGKFAAIPGTSNHGWGRAIDFGSGVQVANSAEYRWMMANAPNYGWQNPLWARDNNPNNGQQEPWHWETSATPVSNYPGKGSGGSVVTPPDVSVPTPPAKKKEPTVRVIQGYGSPHVYSTDGVSLVHLTTQSQVNDMLKVADQTAIVVVGMETINVLAATDSNLASKVATETWSRSIGNIDGVPRTAGQGVALAAAGPLSETITAVGPDQKVYLVNVADGVFAHIPDVATLNALGKRWADPAKRIALTAEGVNTLKAMAKRVRDGV